MSIVPERIEHRARTKIVATIGPACSEQEQLARLVASGVDVFRINMAHSDVAGAQRLVDRIRTVSGQLAQPIGILVDLAGPKIRLGELHHDPLQCPLDGRFDFVRGEVSQGPHELTSTYDLLVDELSPGDMVMLADGTVSMLVVEKLPGRVRCRVVQPGLLRSRQGINLPGVKLSTPALSGEDRQHAEWASAAGADFLGLSFVRSPDDVRQLKELLRQSGSQAMVVAKIEKAEALARLSEVVAASDAVMIARGDLGVEIDVAEVPMEQKRIVAECNRQQRPVIIATQMLDSMQHSLRPTRAETTDVANAILDGGDACMLSGETAIGKHPREAVEMMNRIALATEARLKDRAPLPLPDPQEIGLNDVTQAVVQGAGWVAHRLAARLVVVASHSGATALALAKQRSFVPTVGISDQEETLRRMCLYWGVTPIRGVVPDTVEELIEHAGAWARSAGLVETGDRIVVVAGSHVAAGVHDMVVVHEVK